MSDSVSPLSDTWPPSAEPACAIPARDESADVFDGLARCEHGIAYDGDCFGCSAEPVPYRVTPVVFGTVPVTEELREAVELVDAALVEARMNQPGVVFTDLAGAVRRVGADA